ncbi:hypothetical protein [Intrasporangium mesophilum]
MTLVEVQCHLCLEPLRAATCGLLICEHCDTGCRLRGCPKCAQGAKSQGKGPRTE